MVVLADREVEYRGQRVTYARARYLETQRNQATLARVEDLASAEARDVLYTGRELDRQTFGGFARTVLPPIVDRWGRVNATAAMDHYDTSRDLWYQVQGSRVSRGQAYARSTRYATARTRGAIYKATLPEFNATVAADPVINSLMAAFSQNGLDAGVRAAENALTRAVASYNRDTMLYNSALDEAVYAVQRVAEPDACAFCVQLAVGGYGRTTNFASDYAVEWHDKCRCSIETIYVGDSLIRPDYYDDLKIELDAAQDFDGELGPLAGGSTSRTLRENVQALRAVSGRR